MKTNILFPNHFKRLGWIILIPSALLGVLSLFEVVEFGFLDDVHMPAIFTDDILSSTQLFGVVKNNVSDEILGILCIVGALLVAFSKERHEDEYIAKIRMESLVWAIYVNYAILIFCIMFFYSIGFLYVMIFNMFTTLIFFIIRFYYQLYKSNNSMSYEK